MGKIIYWILIKVAILIPALWYLQSNTDVKFWWIISATAFYAIVIHPAVLQYKHYNNEKKELIENSLCSTCKHFDESAILCLKYDKHVSTDEIPCEGMHWEPK